MTRYLIAAFGCGSLFLAAAGGLAEGPVDKVTTLTRASGDAPAGPTLSGAEIFATNCAACHQPQGQGIPGAFPALAHNVFVTGDPELVAQTLLNGRGGMPSFRDVLDDAAIGAVTSFVRASWGNNAPPIPAAIVAKNRAGNEVVTERPIPAH